MKRTNKNGKLSVQKSLAERRIVQTLLDWTSKSDLPKGVEKVPNTEVEENNAPSFYHFSHINTCFFSPEVSEAQQRVSKRGFLFAFLFQRRNLATLVSVFVHIILALILLSIVLTVRVGTTGIITSATFMSELSDLNFFNESDSSSDVETFFEVNSNLSDSDSFLSTELVLEESNSGVISDTITDNINPILPSDRSVNSAIGAASVGGGIPFFSSNGSASGRTARKNGSLQRKGDVTKESEDAVENGLKWLARHQLPDGSWSFELSAKDGSGHSLGCKCSNSQSTSTGTLYSRGLHPSRMAATAIAILPFLGSGYTHTESGPYQKTVAAGLRFLIYHSVKKEEGVDFRDGFTGDGSSYVQALAVLTCCEAYEITKDENLKSLAEEGMRFIQASQLRDGGWRYSSIGDEGFHDTVDGDLSASGWQMLALKSGISAGFSLPVSVVYRFANFLDLVMDDNGQSYRYQPRTNEDVSKRWGTTAVGVLMREYLGEMPNENPQESNRLDRGVKQVVKWISQADSHWKNVKKGVLRGGIKNREVVYVKDGRLIYNLYFAYYATLALRAYGGKMWEDSYEKIRDMLVATQARSINPLDSCENGSWLFYDQYMNDGGRLLNTALAVLILETPYRYLPMYR